MRKLTRPISIIMTIAYLLLIPLNSFAATGTTVNTGDNVLMNKWKSLGLLDEGVSTSELYQPIQKIDFIRFINSIFKTSKQADIDYIDVPKDSWYGDEIAKAVASGYVTYQQKTNFNPFSNISRLEAAMMVTKVFGLELSDRKLLNKITDAEKLDAQQLTAFGAVIEKGYLSEISIGRYAPLGVLKLSDAMKMLDKGIGLVIAKSGTITKDVTGNMIINASQVVLKEMEISGDLIIGEGVSDGTVTLENVSVNGNMIIRGGGPNGVIIKNSSISDNLVVEKFLGNVNVVAQGTTTIEQTYLRSGATLSETNLTTGKGFVKVTAAQAVSVNQIAKLVGDFSKIDMDSSNINISLSGKAEDIKIMKDTISRFSLSAGSIKNLTTQATQSTIELLGGAVTTLNVDEGAKGNKIDINGITTVSKMNITATTTINFVKGTVEVLNINPSSEGSYIGMKKDAYIKTINANATATITGLGKIDNASIYANNVSLDVRPSSYYVATGITSNINGTSIDPTKSNVSFSVRYANKVNLRVNETQNITIDGLSPSNSTLSYISSDNSIATISDKGVITAINLGSTQVHVMGQYPGYNTKVSDIDVSVASNNVTASGTLDISPPNGETGTNINLVLTYTAGEDMINGAVVIKLPDGFSAYETDTVSIGGSADTALVAVQRPNTQTLSFTNLDLKKATGKIIIKLNNKVVPQGMTYEFTAISDADGSGPKLPTSGEKTTFTSNKLKVLVKDYNFSVPEPGSIGGTTKIATLSVKGFTESTKWLIKVQNAIFAEPNFDDDLSAKGYTPYLEHENIAVVAGQHLMLVAVDPNNKVKAYADITITDGTPGADGTPTVNMIRPYDAGNLVLGDENVIPGIQANTARINGLASNSVPGADHWRIKIQDTSISTVFVDTQLGEGAKDYTSGDDIKVGIGQHIILAAVDTSNKIKAYKVIKVTADMISAAAGALVLDNNFKMPTYGSVVGNTKLEQLLPGGFTAIKKWMVVTLSKQAVIPAMDVSTTEYENSTEKYTEGKVFSYYTENTDIAIAEGQHLLLVGVDVVGTTNKIKAYVDFTIDGAAVRQANVPEIPDINFAAPVMGTTSGTTKLPDLNFNRPAPAPATTLSLEAKKFMVKVQDDAFAIPQMNSMLSGAIDCVANQDIKISGEQHLILLATDANGSIKAYKDIIVSSSLIRPADALKLIVPNDYSLPEIGSQVGSTKIMLSPNGVTGFSKWMYKLQDTAFNTPYVGSEISGLTDYTAGADIMPIKVGQYILIVAVGADGKKTLAYAIEAISYEQIKQPQASELKSSSEVQSNENYNFSVPEVGQVGGTTRITSLNTMGVQGAAKWMYKISGPAATTPAIPEYNSIISGLLPYVAGDSIKVADGQCFTLYAVDNSSRIKAYKNILITGAQIRTPAATLLLSQTNYAPPTSGSTQGKTLISSLSFAGLVGSDLSWKWKYVVGDSIFSAPTKDADISGISNTADLTITTDISIKSGQYILLLAVDGAGAIKGYANIYVALSSIRPYNAGDIAITSYNLTKGSTEGTTSFSKLDLIGIIDAKNWMIKTQQGPFEIPAKDLPLTGATTYTLKSDIKINVDWHILLLATDSLGKVKAYADITALKDQIQAPFAMLLTENANYTNPEPGSAPGTVKIMLNDTGITKATGETVVWKYKKSTNAFNSPLLDEETSGVEYTAYASNQDIAADAGNVVLIVGTINGKIKAFRQFTIDALQIRPANAPDLVLDYNYTGPLAGNAPGTTKINDLKFIGVVGATKWQVKVADKDEVITLDSIFTNPINYTSGIDILVKKNQYVVLAAVDASGKVKAYKNIQITLDTQLNPPLANKLVSGLNYANPKYGSVTGSTAIYVSPQGINGCTAFVVKVISAPVNIIAGDKISYTAASGISFTDFYSYTSGSNIAASVGQYIQLIAVNASNLVLAYENINIPEGSIRPGDAVSLQTPQNYSVLQPGAGVGTTKFTNLDFVGIQGGEKWVVKVLDADLTVVPLINSSVEGATVYSANTDIAAKELQYVVLYAVDTTGKVKGYVSIQVIASNVRGIAPLLKSITEYSIPEPGSVLNTTKFATLKLPAGSNLWKYIVQDTAAETILKDSLLSGFTPYTQGSDISAAEGRHLILVATDNGGYVKAYSDILVTASHLRNVQATLLGTIITAPTGELNITSGGRTIIIKLDYGHWQDDVLTNTIKRNTLYEGFVAAGTEQTQWGKVIAALKTEGISAAEMNSAKDTITITLSEAATYDIAENQEVSLTLKPELIMNGIKPSTAVNKIQISANAIVQLGGTAISQVIGEGDIKAGGKTIIINLPNGEFAADVASNKVKRDAIFDGITASYNTVMWGKVIAALKLACDNAINDLPITRNASNKITIALPAVSDYDITMNEIINLTVPYRIISSGATQEILVGAIKDAAAPTQVTISANSSANLTGTLLTGTLLETNIVSGSKTLVITLTDGQWVTDIETNSTKRNALFTGLVASAETSEWAKVLTALQAAGQAAIVRNDNATVTITLPAVSTYNIANNQYITMDIPAACISGAKAALRAQQTIIVERVAGVTLSGTAISPTVSETDIRLGGKTVIITLSSASWVDTIATDTTIKNALFDGFVADVENDTQWAKVVSELKKGTITKTAANSITITLPVVSGYNITALIQKISVTVPTTAVIGTSLNIESSNTIVINNTPPTAAKIVDVKATTKAYKQGDVVAINVSFDTAVDVTGVQVGDIGIPAINLETGTNDRNAVYASGTGTNVLTFTYTVKDGDSSQKLDYKTKDSLVLQGGNILNMGTGIKAVLTLPVPGSTGSLSDTSYVVVDAIAPKLATGYPKKGTITELTADILVNVNEKATIYYVTRLNDLTNIPNVTQVITEGQSATLPTTMAGKLDMAGDTEGKLPLAGLTAFTDYNVYMVMVDSLGNTSSSVSSFNFKTLDTTPPEFSIGDPLTDPVTYPIQQVPKSDSLINIRIKTNETGTVYMIALPAGSAEPTSAQVKTFKTAGGVVVATNLKATAAITKDTPIVLGVTGLTVSTDYDIYVVCEDVSGNIILSPAKVVASTSQLAWNNVGVDLAKKILVNTTTQMQYSLDDQNWTNCTATNTIIAFDENAEILTIFVREAKNTGNKTLLLPIRGSADDIDKTSIGYDIANKQINNTSTINLQYRINGGTWGALNAKSIATNVEFVPGLLEVRTAATALTATEDSKLPSIPVLIDNIAVPMPAPNLEHSDNENMIQGLDSNYEYRIDNVLHNDLWKTGAVDGAFVGTKKVEVRQKSTKDKLPSVSQIIEFKADTIEVVAAPAPADETSFISSVTITFEENTNKIVLTPQDFKKWFIVGTLNKVTGIFDQHVWGADSDFTANWNTAGNILTIKYTAMTETINPVKIDDEVRIDPLAGIKNSAETTSSYTSTGVITESFHPIPEIVSVKAINSGNNIGFGVGDSIEITFNQKTNKPNITANNTNGISLGTNIDTLLKITDPANSAAPSITWGITKDSAIVWSNDFTKVTITFDAASVAATKLKLNHKITVNTSWGLTDADETTEICNSSAYISGSFTSIPIIKSVIVADGKDSNGASSPGNLNKGDTITITFDQATNEKPITISQLIYYFKLVAADGKTAHSWGVQTNADITWNTAVTALGDKPGSVLTIKLSSISGVTLASGDTLTLSSLAGIKAADGGTLAVGSVTVGSSKQISGGY